MKRLFSFKSLPVFCILHFAFCINATAQGIHFSQYFNAPMLTSPANTGLMSDEDYRVGANYRSQWGAVPVPYHTFSLYGDLQLFRNRNQTNWLGVGFAAFTDKAGDGDLSLNQYELCAAYHIQLGETQMISGGIGLATVQRTVDFSRFTWDAQWDGFSFDGNLSSNERNTVSKTVFTDVSAGLNYAIFPSDRLYLKIGAGAAHLNQPKESFFGQENSIGIRPSATVDALIKSGERLTINPSFYYTSQKGAMEMMYGTMFIYEIGDKYVRSGIIAGAYNRWNDAVVAVIGYERSGLRVMASYDYTISSLGQYINHSGAAELGLVWRSLYHRDHADRRMGRSCPRF
jgi:type IX secretion system PorP/SprF family membrane protein